MSATEPTAIRHRILSDLQVEPAVDPARIEVSVGDDGLVTLEGVVHTYAEKCCIEENIRRVQGVAGVRNGLEVRLTIGDYRTDATLQRVVREMLESLARMPPERPRVSVSDGWVTLEGTVQREFQRQLIEKAVREVAGVKGITNELVVALDSHSG